MKFKTILAASVLAMVPALASAMGCSGFKPEQTAMTCAEGMVLDAASGTCVSVTTS